MDKNKKRLSEEAALKEFERWLDFKKVKTKKRDGNKDQQESIIEAIVDGDIRIDEKCNIIYKLLQPITDDGGEVFLAELTFKPRLKVHEFNSKMKGVKANDVDGRLVAYVSALTGQNSGVIRKLDVDDYSICQNIIMYFL
jgi:hypothetical protein